MRRGEAKLHLADFVLTSPPDELAIWVYREEIATDLGACSLSLQTDPATSPDLKMVEMAKDLIVFVNRNPSKLVDIIYAGYRFAQGQDPAWVATTGTPSNLPRERVLEYLLPPHELIISRHTQFMPPYLSSVLFTPRWDEEHGLDLVISQNDIESINGSTTLLGKLLKA